MVLKARNEFTVTLRPKEFHLRGEKTLFQAYVVDIYNLIFRGWGGRRNQALPYNLSLSSLLFPSFPFIFLFLKKSIKIKKLISPPSPNYSRIVDDGYHHSLIVFQDRLTEGIRLHAAVWDGELVECPVWTIFVTPHRHPCPLTTSGVNNKLLGTTSSSDDDGDDTAARVGGEVGSGDGGSSRGLGSSRNKGWLEPRGRHVVWLHDVQLYVFCDKYREARMRRKRGAFELYFVAEQGECSIFPLFAPPPSLFIPYSYLGTHNNNNPQKIN